MPLAGQGNGDKLAADNPLLPQRRDILCGETEETAEDVVDMLTSYRASMADTSGGAEKLWNHSWLRQWPEGSDAARQ
jgi:hypothetical protein